MLIERTHDVFDRRSLLTHRDINTGDSLTFLIDDRVDRDGSFTGLTVANDQFSLTTTDRHH